LSDKSPESNDFLVCNADNICGDEYYQVIQNQIQTDPNCGVLVATQINELEILKTLGVFVVDSNDYLINVAEKSSIFVSNLANIGIYYFPNNIKKLIATTRSPLMDKEETITDLFNLYLGQSPIKIVSGTDVYVAISTEQDLKIN
jgi:NDP-sugar pyrophosphorylase family protein